VAAEVVAAVIAICAIELDISQMVLTDRQGTLS